MSIIEEPLQQTKKLCSLASSQKKKGTSRTKPQMLSILSRRSPRTMSSAMGLKSSRLLRLVRSSFSEVCNKVSPSFSLFRWLTILSLLPASEGKSGSKESQCRCRCHCSFALLRVCCVFRIPKILRADQRESEFPLCGLCGEECVASLSCNVDTGVVP